MSPASSRSGGGFQATRMAVPLASLFVTVTPCGARLGAKRMKQTVYHTIMNTISMLIWCYKLPAVYSCNGFANTTSDTWILCFVLHIETSKYITLKVKQSYCSNIIRFFSAIYRNISYCRTKVSIHLLLMSWPPSPHCQPPGIHQRRVGLWTRRWILSSADQSSPRLPMGCVPPWCSTAPPAGRVQRTACRTPCNPGRMETAARPRWAVDTIKNSASTS